MFIGSLTVCTSVRFGESLASNYKEPIKYIYIYMNNQSCQARPTLGNINSDETPFSSIYCYAGVCVLNKTNNMNVKKK